jgi:hypothetical protein
MESIFKIILKLSSEVQFLKFDMLTIINFIQALKSSLILMRNYTFLKKMPKY